MREAILAAPKTSPLNVTTSGIGRPYDVCISGATVGETNNQGSGCWFNQAGLGIKTYLSDRFNNWLSTEWIDGEGGIADISSVDVSDGMLKMDALILAKKIYDMMNRIAVSDGSYQAWQEVIYDEKALRIAESPMYVGGMSSEIVFDEVVSNSATEDQPLGTLAGRGAERRARGGNGIKIKVREPSYIIGIVSLTPRVDYSQGNKWDTTLKTWDDFHKPNLDQIGFQELIQEQMAWWTTRKVVGLDQFVQRSAGKQPAWINYMTNVNEVRGNFAVRDNEMFMTLNRRYEYEYIPGTQDQAIIADMTTYIDPSKFNNVFAQTSLDAQNFWIQLSVDITARRKMSAKVMPNL